MATRLANRRPLRALACVLPAVMALALVPACPVAAEPSPAQRITTARRRLATLNERVSRAVEDFNEATIALDRATKRAEGAEAGIARAQRRLADLQVAFGEVAAAAYRSGGDQLLALVTTSTPQTFLDRASTLDQIARNQTDQVTALRAASIELGWAQKAGDQAIAEARALRDHLERVKDDIDKQVAEQRALVRRLETRARPRASRGQMRTSPGPGPGGSARAKVAVQWAYRQIGKPYRWGGSGPDAFDCSGLTMYVWGKAGVSLPHSSRAQFGEGRHVSRGELAPGDLVFYGSPIHHVGIYVGGGNYIHAPQSGDRVSVDSINRGGYAGAVRL